MKNLIIIGAGSWGQEIFAWLPDAIGYGNEWTFKGFLDDNPEALNDVSFCDYPVLGTENSYKIQTDDVFVCAIANPILREKVVMAILNQGGTFINIIHKNVIFLKNVTLGTGNVISPNCILSNNCTVGNHVAVNLACTLGHDTLIGDYCQISSQCDITGFVKVGKNVFMGSRVSIIPNLSVGDEAKIGAGSIVIRKVKKGISVFGNPAKEIL